MRHNFLSRCIAALLCAAMLSMSSCIGSFSLTNRLMGWNQHIGNKFLNELVFFAFWILPVYEVTALADVLVLNSIEFWTGDNPMAKGERIIEGNDGRYLVRCDGKGYDVVSCNDGTSVRLDFNAKTNTWSYTAAGQTREIFTFVDDTHISLPTPDGSRTIVEISQQGLYAYGQMVTDARAFAAR